MFVIASIRLLLKDVIMCWLVGLVGIRRRVCLYYVNLVVTARRDNVLAHRSSWC